MVIHKWYYKAQAQAPDKSVIDYSGIVYASTPNTARKKLLAGCKTIGARLKKAEFSIYPPEGRKEIIAR